MRAVGSSLMCHVFGQYDRLLGTVLLYYKEHGYLIIGLAPNDYCLWFPIKASAGHTKLKSYLEKITVFLTNNNYYILRNLGFIYLLPLIIIDIIYFYYYCFFMARPEWQILHSDEISPKSRCLK